MVIYFLFVVVDVVMIVYVFKEFLKYSVTLKCLADLTYDCYCPIG